MFKFLTRTSSAPTPTNLVATQRLGLQLASLNAPASLSFFSTGAPGSHLIGPR